MKVSEPSRFSRARFHRFCRYRRSDLSRPCGITRADGAKSDYYLRPACRVASTIIKNLPSVGSKLVIEM